MKLSLNRFIGRRNLARFLILLVTALFLGYLVWQHQYVFLYHDDYGYASLSYAYRQDGVAGQSFTLIQMLSYLRTHYLVWGGRILYFGIEIVLLRVGLPVLRLLQPILIAVLFLKAFQIANLKEVASLGTTVNLPTGNMDATERISVTTSSSSRMSDVLIAAAGFATFGLYSLDTYRTGIFWFTSSILYVFPIALFFSLIVFQTQLASHWIHIPNSSRWLKLLLCALGSFAAAFSQEQIAIMVLTFLFLEGLRVGIHERRLTAVQIVPFLAALAGAAILFLAPGNRVRMQTTPEFYSLSLGNRALRNLPEIVRQYLTADNRYFVVLICITIIFAAIQTSRRSRLMFWLARLHVTVTFAILVAYLFFANTLRNLSANIKGDLLLIAAGAGLYLLFSALLVIVALVQARRERVLLLFIAALASQAAMLNTPYVVERMMIPFLFTCSVVFMALFDCLITSSRTTVAYGSVVAVTILVLVMGVSGMTRLLTGYRTNAPLLAQNDQTLQLKAADIMNGDQVREIRLYKLLPDGLRYAGDQSYTDDFGYIDFYIREYYNIPQGVQLVWQEAG